jgi:monofunctional biosynthetic peptidoglycan transglycosylase
VVHDAVQLPDGPLGGNGGEGIAFEQPASDDDCTTAPEEVIALITAEGTA